MSKCSASWAQLFPTGPFLSSWWVTAEWCLLIESTKQPPQLLQIPPYLLPLHDKTLHSLNLFDLLYIKMWKVRNYHFPCFSKIQNKYHPDNTLQTVHSIALAPMTLTKVPWGQWHRAYLHVPTAGLVKTICKACHKVTVAHLKTKPSIDNPAMHTSITPL